MASLTKGIFIVAAKRTPIGSFGGKLVDKTIADLGEVAAKAALTAGNIDPKWVDSVVFGNVGPNSSADGPYMSRHVLLRCGILQDKPALTINRMCGSGFQSIVNGAHEIIMGDAKIVLTGGSENMSQSPFYVRNIRFGTKLGVQHQLEDHLLSTMMDAMAKTHMGGTAENLAVKYKLTREDVDKFALQSQQRWKAAHDAGRFKEELAPVMVKVKKQEVEMNMDEHPKPNTTFEILSKLQAVFKKDGTVTAGNASGISDGAGVVIIASEAACKEYNLKPLARLIGYGVAGVDPTIMGIGPVPAIQKVLKVSGKKLDDMDLIEINEAFAPQTLACQKELGIDNAKLNTNGGAISMGHPVGASGARIMGHLTHELRRTGKNLAIGSACIGGGQGIALMIERM